MSNDSESKRSSDRNGAGADQGDITPELEMLTFLDHVEIVNEINPDHARQWLERIGVNPGSVPSIVELARNRGVDSESPEGVPPGACGDKPVSAMTQEELLNAVEEKSARDRRRQQARYEAIIASLGHEDLVQIQHWIDSNVQLSTKVSSVDLREATAAGQISRDRLIAFLCSEPVPGQRSVSRAQMEDEHGQQTILTVTEQN